MIYIGIDDTDTLDSPGTNQLAKELARMLAADFACLMIVRHQLFFDPRVPYTSKNGSASMTLSPRGAYDLQELTHRLRQRMRAWFVPGSDPGLCVATSVPPEVTSFARKAKQDLVTQDEAHAVASACGLHLEGLGGTNGGVIGALAAVGLIVTGDDGRIVQSAAWQDDLSGETALAELLHRGVEIRCGHTSAILTPAVVDIGKHLRPNLRGGRAVLFVEQHNACWRALKLV
jgi:hypothetical protein